MRTAGSEEIVETSVLELLLPDVRIEAQAKNERRITALHHAVHEGKREVVEVLLAQRGADLDFKDFKGATPLNLAAYHPKPGFFDIARKLLAEPENGPLSHMGAGLDGAALGFAR
ncbi:hypothetical protein PpBr36_05114 [Pyricularia pennisetigena]|uniref:hypothetical protein n=1 Tax=Pyricularia pennisetigena TaxID=1578925 RepID=UPI00115477BF|nr:hypothetical protein PpBr36_05114 [Pyricularia pennisetigena]TLS26576.1 hypothetical protein PpBr36_05114 [Pyricularia pennisetigena]